MRVALTISTVLITVFGVASGVYKIAGGEADLRIFAHLGMGPILVRVFGLLQALASCLVFHRSLGVIAAGVLTACNALATAGLFAAGVQPFGWISLVFVAMAAGAVSWAHGRRNR